MTSPPRKLIIAIDGPAGAGKSTIASRLAQQLGYINLETGAMYRALGLQALATGTPLDQELPLVALAERSAIELQPVTAGNRVLLDGMDVSQRIRQQDVTDAASRISMLPRVREWMVARQREMGAGGGVVMEGRDIGTKVFPDADVKVFLEANSDIRAQRRLKQEPVVAHVADARSIADEIRERDRRDATRAVSPLMAADDAVIIDSSHLTIEQVLDEIARLVQSKLQA